MPSLKNRVPIKPILDSTGLLVFGKSERAAANPGCKGIQGWKKGHRAIDSDDMILTHKLTERTVDNGNTGVSLIEEIKE